MVTQTWRSIEAPRKHHERLEGYSGTNEGLNYQNNVSLRIGIRKHLALTYEESGTFTYNTPYEDVV